MELRYSKIFKTTEKYDNFMLINFKLETERVNIKKI